LVQIHRIGRDAERQICDGFAKIRHEDLLPQVAILNIAQLVAVVLFALESVAEGLRDYGYSKHSADAVNNGEISECTPGLPATVSARFIAQRTAVAMPMSTDKQDAIIRTRHQ
jgi:hypothetical protein